MRKLVLTLRVITDAEGRVLATQQVVEPEYSRPAAETLSPADDSVRAYRRIIPGPDQSEYTVDLEIAEGVLDPLDVDALHELVRVETDRIRASSA